MTRLFETGGSVTEAMLRTLRAALLPQKAQLTCLSIGGGLLILSVILLGYGYTEYGLLSLLCLGIVGMAFLMMMNRATQAALKQMNAETDGAGYGVTTFFDEDGITEERIPGGQTRHFAYADLTACALRERTLILRTTSDEWLPVFADTLSPQERSALLLHLREKQPAMDFPIAIEKRLPRSVGAK